MQRLLNFINRHNVLLALSSTGMWVIFLIVLIIAACSKDEDMLIEPMGSEFRTDTLVADTLVPDTFYVYGKDFGEIEDIYLTWRVIYRNGRWQAQYKWQGRIYYDYMEVVTTCFRHGYQEPDFTKLNVNGDMGVRGNIRVKLPDCITSKQEAINAAEALYFDLDELCQPITWVVITNDCEDGME